MNTTHKRGSVSLMIMALAFVVWIAETWYYGWNLRAQSAAESMWDFAVVALFAIAFFNSYTVTVSPRKD